MSYDNYVEMTHIKNGRVSMKYRDIQFQWDDLYKTWTGICYSSFPNILKSVEVRDVKINDYPRKDEYFWGYDWVHNSRLEKRIDFVSNRTIDFLLSGKALNEGTLQTLKYLICAKDDIETISAILIYAYSRDLLNNVPHEWKGDSFSLLNAINLSSMSYLRSKGMLWHHAMRNLMPDTCISNIVLSCMTPTSEYVILELAAINANYVLSNYTILEYDSRSSE